jgi:antitoxin component HigA of HigAB toxin-antitoxin module
MPKFRRGAIDMTGNGLGLTEYAQDKWGMDRIEGVNFATTEPITDKLMAEGRKAPTARVTEIMATEMVAIFEDRAIDIPVDAQLREDLSKPEKLTSPGGRVSIAATRNEAGHADHFWAIALGIRAGTSEVEPGQFSIFSASRINSILSARRDRTVNAFTGLSARWGAADVIIRSYCAAFRSFSNTWRDALRRGPNFAFLFQGVDGATPSSLEQSSKTPQARLGWVPGEIMALSKQTALHGALWPLHVDSVCLISSGLSRLKSIFAHPPQKNTSRECVWAPVPFDRYLRGLLAVASPINPVASMGGVL